VSAIEGPTPLTLEELCAFLLDPARGFLERGLDLQLPREAGAGADDEPLAPGDGLTRWRLTRALLEFGEGNACSDYDMLRARGQLPPGALGDEALREARARADALRAAAVAFTGGAASVPMRTLWVEWDDGTRVQGTPADLYPNGVLQVRAGAIDGRQVLRAWLDALLCAAAGTEQPVVLVGLDGTGGRSFALPQLAPEPARAQLHGLCELYRKGSFAPLPFFVRTSWDHARDCAKAERKSGTPPAVEMGAFDKAARQAARADGFGAPGELASDAVAIAWRGRDLPGPEDGALAQRLHRISMTVFEHPARAWTEQFP
jgi:exonuclease V gamma subunit